MRQLTTLMSERQLEYRSGKDDFKFFFGNKFPETANFRNDVC